MVIGVWFCLCFVVVVLGIEPGASSTLDKHSTPAPHGSHYTVLCWIESFHNKICFKPKGMDEIA